MRSAVRSFDEKTYGKLLVRALPRMISNERENERMLRQVETLMAKGAGRTAEENALMQLLTHLIQQYEEAAYPIPDVAPREILRHLLEENGLRPIDLEAIIPRSRMSEILNGKRAISKAQAKRLAEFFHVGADLFL